MLFGFLGKVAAALSKRNYYAEKEEGIAEVGCLGALICEGTHQFMVGVDPRTLGSPSSLEVCAPFYNQTPWFVFVGSPASINDVKTSQDTPPPL